MNGQRSWKHLNLVDGIALFLVTDEKYDAAAVSFQQTATSIDFFYAKNRPCVPAELKYVDSMLKLNNVNHLLRFQNDSDILL